MKKGLAHIWVKSWSVFKQSHGDNTIWRERERKKEREKSLSSLYITKQTTTIIWVFESQFTSFKEREREREREKSMGRPPCCDKVGIKKGPWTPEEDILLVSYIQQHGPGNWRSVPTNTGISFLSLIPFSRSTYLPSCLVISWWFMVNYFNFSFIIICWS